MKNFKILAATFYCLCFGFANAKAEITNLMEEGDADVIYSPAYDTLKTRTLTLLTAHMNDLKDLKNRSGQFQSGFIKNNPYVPCDYCEQHKDVELSAYVFNITAPGRFPEGLNYTYEILDKRDDIYVDELTTGFYYVTVNVKKTVTGLLGADNQVNPAKSRTTYLVYKFELNYNDNVIGINSLTESKPPGENVWMLEFNPNFRLTSPDYSGQDVFDVSSSNAILAKFGAVYYFNPFKGVNKSNIWLKAGARVSYMMCNLNADLVDFRDNGVVLDGHTAGNPHRIDLRYDVSDVHERLTAVGIEIPIGFSKRFKLDNKKELSLELEASYTYEILKQVSGDYALDLLGTNHLLNSDVQSASGGNPVIYDNSPQAVQTADGETIRFLRGSAGQLDNNETTTMGYLTFSFRPSLLIKKYEVLKYNIGLNFSYLNMANDPFNVDQTYFNPNRSTALPTLHQAEKASGHFFAGIFFGIKI